MKDQSIFNSSSFWTTIKILLSLILFLEIFLSANNKSLWYDDIDGLMYGQMLIENSGRLDENNPPPIDICVIDETGRNSVYQPLWLLINALVYKLALPFPLWRAMNVLFLISALFIYLNWRKLSGMWCVFPLIMAIFSDLTFRAGGLVRNYNFTALLLVLTLISWQNRNKRLWPFIISLILLWQSNLGGFLFFAIPHASFLIFQINCNQHKKRNRRLLLFYFLIMFIQYIQMSSVKINLFTYQLDTLDRLSLVWQSMNYQAFSLIIALPLLTWGAFKFTGETRWMFMFLLLHLSLLPMIFYFYRSVYLIMLAPILFVEISFVFSKLKGRLPIVIALLASLTQIFSLNAEIILPQVNKKTFHAPVHYSHDLLKKAPLAALFEARHRKWTRDDAITDYIIKHVKNDDYLFYEFSRLSVLARIWHQSSIKITGMLHRQLKRNLTHPYAVANPQTSLAEVNTPFWALTPEDVIGTEQREDLSETEMVEKLSYYGNVTVHRIPKSNADWVKNNYWSIADRIAQAKEYYLVYYVE